MAKQCENNFLNCCLIHGNNNNKNVWRVCHGNFIWLRGTIPRGSVPYSGVQAGHNASEA